MAGPAAQHVSARRLRRDFFLRGGAAVVFLLCACAAATRPADPNQPRADAPDYPILLEASEERREKALAAWSVLAGEQAASGAPSPELRPVTATIVSLPAALAAPLRLPKVTTGEAGGESEEETRESLRRFVETAAPLLGLERRATAAAVATERESTLGDLSLVAVTDDPGGTKIARYVQNPFDLPLRNGFGEIEIGFTSDLRVTRLSSTAVPDTDRLRRAVADARQGLAEDKLAASLLNRTLTFTGPDGNRQTRTLAAGEARVHDLVVFPQRRAGDRTKLELRLAWELAIGSRDAPLLAYVDAVTGEQLQETDGGSGRQEPMAESQ